VSFNPDETSSFVVHLPPEDLEATKVGPWIRRSTSVPYVNPWIQVEHHEVTDPSGKNGIYGVVRFKHLALGCVPLHDDGTVTLVGQHRYPLDVWSWEIPSGGGRKDREMLPEIMRELKEETGLEGTEWIELGSLQTSNSVTDEKAFLWLARGLREGQNQPESTEGDLEVKRVPFAEAVEMAYNGQLTDAISVAGLLRAARWMEKHPG
jgi:8-oxo-dGTP pyrophosphatase MutT (NUDIX family)